MLTYWCNPHTLGIALIRLGYVGANIEGGVHAELTQNADKTSLPSTKEQKDMAFSLRRRPYPPETRRILKGISSSSLIRLTTAVGTSSPTRAPSESPSESSDSSTMRRPPYSFSSTSRRRPPSPRRQGDRPSPRRREDALLLLDVERTTFLLLDVEKTPSFSSTSRRPPSFSSTSRRRPPSRR